MTNTNGQDQVLRVAFPSDKPATDYEPTKIHFDSQYIFLENVYSPLVEFDKIGALRGGVAEHADWVGNELRLTIRPGLKTENGTPITAADVIFSLKRLLVLSSNTHGNFKDLVCPGVQLKTVEDDCPDLKQDGNVVIIKAEKREPFLLPMLAAIDFAIIPRSSTDPNTLKIINYKETSGPYYVTKDDGHGHIELKINPYSYHVTKDIPQTVELVPELTAESSLKALLNDQVDLITTIDAARADKVLPFAEKHPEFRLHATKAIRETFLLFTARGLKDFSVNQRRFISDKVRGIFSDIYKSTPGFNPIDTFFPSFSDVGLNSHEQAEIDELKRLGGTRPERPIEIGLLHQGHEKICTEMIRKYLPNAHCSPITNIPGFESDSSAAKMPDAYVASTDTSFQEDINLISYSLNAGLFGLTKPERADWLAKYMSIDDKHKRIQMLRKLQFDALSSATIAPLLSSPYTALVRKPWHFELPAIYANDPFWLIKRD